MDAINQGMLFFVSAYQSSDLFKIIAYIVIVNRINFNSKGVLYCLSLQGRARLHRKYECNGGGGGGGNKYAEVLIC